MQISMRRNLLPFYPFSVRSAPLGFWIGYLSHTIKRVYLDTAVGAESALPLYAVKLLSAPKLNRTGN
jgi:hypothetical protein